MFRTEAEWLSEYEQRGALWKHNGSLKGPHPVLRSGMHSNGFFNSRLIIADEELLRQAACDLLELFVGSQKLLRADGVAGPQTGATKLAELLSNEITKRRKKGCFWVSPAKYQDKTGRTMAWEGEDASRLLGKNVLLCEDVISTGGSIELTARAVSRAGGSVLPYVLVLVNRSSLREINGKKIIALIECIMPLWDPAKSECPLCEAGSQPLPVPKEHWKSLH
ncbi:MAG TPA: phosphoribosyltransferase family protein [Candidatus Paceibacterota bacterium]|nr:phosphoribosyltransferase family protein [Candidatus Paceibacterota bacterium]